MEEEEEEDEEEEDTEFPSEILFRFRLGTLVSFSAGKEGRHEVSEPCEWSLNAGIHPAAPTSPPAEHPPAAIRCATVGDMGLASTTWHGAASFPQAPAKKIPKLSESQTPALTEPDIPQTSVCAGCFGAVKVPAVMTVCPYICICIYKVSCASLFTSGCRRALACQISLLYLATYFHKTNRFPIISEAANSDTFD